MLESRCIVLLPVFFLSLEPSQQLPERWHHGLHRETLPSLPTGDCLSSSHVHPPISAAQCRLWIRLPRVSSRTLQIFSSSGPFVELRQLDGVGSQLSLEASDGKSSVLFSDLWLYLWSHHSVGDDSRLFYIATLTIFHVNPLTARYNFSTLSFGTRQNFSFLIPGAR